MAIRRTGLFLCVLYLVLFGVSCRRSGAEPPPAAVAIQNVPAPAPTPTTPPPPVKTDHLRVLVVSDGNAFVRAALLDGPFEVEAVTPRKYPVPGPFHATIFDRVAPPVAHDAGILIYLGATGKRAPLETHGMETDLSHAIFERVAKDAAILRFTDLGEVNLASVIRATAGPRDEVVGASDTLPLLVTGSRDEHSFVAFNFDVRRSDLPMRVDWPIVLVQALNTSVDRDLFSVPLAARTPPTAVDSNGSEPRTRSETIYRAASGNFGGSAYRKVYAEYRAVAEERLARPGLPATVRTYVEHYFDAIAPR